MTNSKKSRGGSRAIPILIIVLLLLAGILAAGIAVSGRIGKVAHPLKYVDELKAAADRYGLERSLVAAVVETESSFRADAVSGDGAVGLMQILPSTAEWIAFRKGEEYVDGSLTDPAVNLDYGCWLLRFLLDRYGGNTRFALIAYNAGHGRLDAWLKDDPTGELPEIPYAETRGYVNRVTSCMEKYEKMYEKELGDN